MRENEMTILRRTRKAMMRAMCEVKLIEKRSQELYEFAMWTCQGDWTAMVWACFEKR